MQECEQVPDSSEPSAAGSVNCEDAVVTSQPTAITPTEGSLTDVNAIDVEIAHVTPTVEGERKGGDGIEGLWCCLSFDPPYYPRCFPVTQNSSECGICSCDCCEGCCFGCCECQSFQGDCAEVCANCNCDGCDCSF